MSASMIAPSLLSIAQDLGVSASTAQMTMSSYFLGMAFAPFLIASASEIWGRKKVWVVCNVLYVVWNTLCPVGRRVGLMIAGRIMAGAGASVGVTLNGPVMADMYGEQDRGKSLAMVTLLPYLGPALGPIVGGIVTQLVHWSWIFWIMSIFNAVIIVLGIFSIRETYTPVLLRRKAATVDNRAASVRSAYKERVQVASNLTRPLRLLIKRPIIWITALTGTLSFGAYTLMLSTYATLWIDKYDQSELVGSLHYISIALGSTMSGQVGGHIMDAIYRMLSKRVGGQGVPEFRIPYMLPGMILMPAGLIWYGWCAERKLSWVMVDFGVVVFTLGSFVITQATGAYQIGEFGRYAASAGAASRSVSYLLAFIFPIFAPDMYSNLGYGWGNNTLAFVSMGLGLPICTVMWTWGARLRALGRKEGEFGI
ncbi:Nn.00g015290.m01.CDS01 [Neocucurbitaria sp. VM-36]